MSSTLSNKAGKHGVRFRLAAVLALMLVTACQVPPGTGPLAESGFARCAEISKALDAYKADRGQFPDHLGLLVPEFLDEVSFNEGGVSTSYWKNAEGDYRLEFTYAAGFSIGITKCTLRSVDRVWSCHSYV